MRKYWLLVLYDGIADVSNSKESGSRNITTLITNVGISQLLGEPEIVSFPDVGDFVADG